MSYSKIAHRQYGVQNTGVDQLLQSLKSELLEFVVGRNGERFIIHSGFVKLLSEPFHDLMKARLKESKEEHICLDDIDVEIFSCFIQFVYRGSYKVFGNEEVTSPETSASEPAQSGISGLRENTNEFGQPRIQESAFELPYSLASYKAAAEYFLSKEAHRLPSENDVGLRPFSRTTCSCRFDSVSPKKLGSVTTFMETHSAQRHDANGDASVNDFEQKPTPTHATTFANVLICHARVWGFANKYSATPLMDSASQLLAHELAHWTISTDTFVPILRQLLQYIYSDNTGEALQLRLLVAHFVTCLADDWSCLEGWYELLQEVPQFAVDIVDVLGQARGLWVYRAVV